MADLGDQFDLVVICSANRFRSPVAEAFLRAATDGLPVSVRSLGLKAAAPLAAIHGAVAEAAELGVDVSAHRARPLRGEALDAVDLVLGFETIHVAEAVVDCGAPRERAFTMLEFFQLLERFEPPLLFDPVERGRRVVARAHLARLTRPAVDPSFEFADPLAGPESAYPTVVGQIKRVSDRIAEGLFGSTA